MNIQSDRYIWLLSKKLSGDLSPAEQQELEVMLKADPQLAKGQELMQRFWKGSEAADDHAYTARAFDKLVQQMKNADAWEEQLPTVKRRWLGPFLRAAAVVTLLAGSAWLLYATGVLSTGDNLRTDRNMRGTRSLIKLADGTTVWLNADSEIRYPTRFSGTSREVYLSGEAYFDVARDAEKPFIVHTDRMKVEVLGTSFNVKSYPGDKAYEATLISGEVEVVLAAQPDKKIRLKPSEKLIIPGKDSLPVHHTANTPLIIPPTYFPLEDSAIIETAWVDNKLLFRDETFATLATRMERWYNVTIRFENNNVEQLRFTGIFKTETLTQAMAALQIIESFNYRQEDDTIIIY